MSIKLSSLAWNLKIPSTTKLVLLCLCDFANDQGQSCWPAIATIALRTSRDVRTVQRAIRTLENMGIVSAEMRPGQSALYRIDLRHSDGGDKRPGVTAAPDRGDSSAAWGDTLPPKPSRTIKDPSTTCASNDAPAPQPDEGDDENTVSVQDVFDGWNAMAPRIGKPLVQRVTDSRRKLLKARIAQYSVDDFRKVFRNAEESPFLRGDTGWHGFSFDWMFKQANFVKILEGNYNG